VRSHAAASSQSASEQASYRAAAAARADVQ
jgi:hypothetical protein